MAIRINIESPETCWRAYLNYHCYGNTMGITGEEMGAIINRWGDQIPTWQKNAQTNDEVKYEFDDSEFEDYKTEGYNNAKKENGDGVDMEAASARAGGDWTGAVLSTGAGGASSLIASSSGKKVVWPSRADAISSVKVVLISTIIIAVILGVLDLVFVTGMNLVF